MTIQRLLLALALAATLAAQTFIQMSDTQFGMYTKDADFAHETANFEFAIATANRLRPAFVVVTGDLTNKLSDGAQTVATLTLSGIPVGAAFYANGLSNGYTQITMSLGGAVLTGKRTGGGGRDQLVHGDRGDDSLVAHRR